MRVMVDRAAIMQKPIKWFQQSNACSNLLAALSRRSHTASD